MQNMDERISKISAKITKSNGEIWLSKIDLDYAYGQAKLATEASRHCVFSIIGGDFTGHYRFKILRPIGYPHRVPRTNRQSSRI